MILHYYGRIPPDHIQTALAVYAWYYHLQIAIEYDRVRVEPEVTGLFYGIGLGIYRAKPFFLSDEVVKRIVI